MNLFYRKLPAGQDAQPLRRCLSAWDLTFIGIGQMIGAGIFVLTGVVAATQAGPAIMLSFVIAGIACAFVAFAYAELASCVGGCGSAYGYAYALFGEMFAWIIGWNMVFGMAVALAAVANGWSGYFSNALTAMGVGLPEIWSRGPAAGGVLNLPATGIILALMFLLFAGVKQSAKTNTAIVLVKVTALVVFIAVAAFHINPALWRPFMPFGWLSQTENGQMVGVLAAAALVFFAYTGFHTVAVAVEEARRPQRDIPVGILSALLVCAAIYLMVSGLLTAIAPYTDLNVPSPIAYALLQLGINWGSVLVAAGVIIGLTSTMLVLYYGLTRILFAMARDGLLPPFFGAVDKRTQTPQNATILCGLVTATIAGVVPFGSLVELVNAGRLTEFSAVCLAVIVLRLTRPDLPRSFKAPGGLIFPVLGILACGALLSFLPRMQLLRFLLWLGLGVVVYFAYVARRRRAAVEPA
jgi:APA family basic amino acid/polyamine antiporter